MATEDSATGDKLDSPANTGGGKKKKKTKTKTVALNEFLADGSSDTSFSAPKRTTSWADASEDLESDEAGVSWQEPSRVDRRALPTAPRASTQPRVEMSRLPSKPPYTAYMGNLSFEVEEDDVMEFFKRRNMKVTSVRLPRDTSNRLKGFGYAEFEDLQSFLDALTLNDEQLRGRPVRLDVAEGDDKPDRRGSRSSDFDRGDWRRSHDQGMEYRKGDRDPDYRRERSSDIRRDRESEFRSDSNFRRDRDSDHRRDGKSEWSDLRLRRDDSSYRRDRDVDTMKDHDVFSENDPEYRDRDPECRDRDLEYRRGGDRDSDYRRRDRDSDYGRGDRDLEYRRGDRDLEYRRGDRDPEYKRDRDSRYRRGGSDSEYRRGDGDMEYRRDRDTGYRRGERDSDYGRGDHEYRRRDRDMEYGRGSRDSDYRKDRDFEYRRDQESEYRRDRDTGYRRGRGGRDFSYRQEDIGSKYENAGPSQELVKERPKLQLQPRTRPLNSDSDDTSRSSIFGQAKPVDTTAREKEIEERLLRQQQQQQPEQARPSSRGDSYPHGDKELHIKNKDSHKDKEPNSDKEPLSKKTNKESKGPPPNAWLKGRPRILEKQDDTPVFSQPSKYAALLTEDNSSQDE